jgi:hypothetical protein
MLESLAQYTGVLETGTPVFTFLHEYAKPGDGPDPSSYRHLITTAACVLLQALKLGALLVKRLAGEKADHTSTRTGKSTGLRSSSDKRRRDVGFSNIKAAGKDRKNDEDRSSPRI